MIGPSSPVVRVSVRVVTPLALVVAIYFFFAGHNRPGGGFAAGLVLGAVIALREVAGIRRPLDATRVMAAGGIVAGLVAIAPLFAGDVLLDQVVVETTVPVLGKIKAGSSLLFDAGVALVVVGLIVAVLDGLVGDQLADRSPDPTGLIDRADAGDGA